LEMGGSVRVAVIDDTSPLLQALRAEIRPEGPEIDGILGAAALAAAGRVTLLLWLTLALLAAMAVFVRNVYGFVAVFVVGGAVFAASWYGSDQVQTAVVYIGAWFLLLGSVRPVFEVAGQRRRGRARTSDPDQLAGITGVPAGLWLFVFGLGTAAAATAGGRLLLDPLL
ncbi:MAG: M50 family metallopeptidase, partial [Stackebrandtia sp.]